MLKYGGNAIVKWKFLYMTMHGGRKEYQMNGGRQLLSLCIKVSVVRKSFITINIGG